MVATMVEFVLLSLPKNIISIQLQKPILFPASRRIVRVLESGLLAQIMFILT